MTRTSNDEDAVATTDFMVLFGFFPLFYPVFRPARKEQR